jgi:hypothetical protein
MEEDVFATGVGPNEGIAILFVDHFTVPAGMLISSPGCCQDRSRIACTARISVLCAVSLNLSWGSVTHEKDAAYVSQKPKLDR